MRLHAFLVLLAVTLALAVSLLWFWNMLKPYSDLINTPSAAVIIPEVDPDPIDSPSAAVITPESDPEKQLNDLVAAHEASLASLTPAQLDARAAGFEDALSDRPKTAPADPAGTETE